MKQTAVQWLFEKLLENPTSIEEINYNINVCKLALEMERNQHGNTWDAAIQAYEDRGHVKVRAWSDFDEYKIN